MAAPMGSPVKTRVPEALSRLGGTKSRSDAAPGVEVFLKVLQ